MSFIRETLKSKSLDELGQQAFQLLEAVRRAEAQVDLHSSNALERGLDLGDTLDEALSRVPAGKKDWLKDWLRDHCSIGVSTAHLFIQLARHRSEIEAEIERVGGLSIRGARRLIAKPRLSPRKSTPGVIAAMRKATDAERTEMLDAFGFEPFLRVMPAEWRTKLEARIVNLRADDGHVDLKITAILRQALSLIKIANTVGTSPAAANANKNEACAALQQLNASLARSGFDLNDVRIGTVKMESKSRRRAA